MRVIIIIVALLISSQFAFAQKDKEKLLPHFDQFDYYAGGQTIKTAYCAKYGFRHGYAMDFNEQGQPTSIGVYQFNKRVGRWVRYDGSVINYDTNSPVETIPGCGTGLEGAIKYFEELYNMILNGKHTLLEYYKSK